MLNENRITLSKHRIEIAKERLKSARLLVDYDDYKAAANRSYYAAFSAMRAVLALDGLDFKKHSGVIAEFRKKYIKTGIFDATLSHMIDSLKDVRQSSDYDDFYLISKEAVLLIRRVKNDRNRNHRQSADVFGKACQWRKSADE